MLKENDDNFSISPRLSTELIEEDFQLSESLKLELDKLYEDVASKFKVGKVLTGKIISKDGSGVLVSIDYKSDGLIPNYEFSDHELQQFATENEIDVLLDKLEDENGIVVLSYQKAKALRAWEKISELASEDEPVRGVVTHKVKGGLSVDVGIPAFLPGSQIDVQRITDFDQFVGQEVVCKILKVNKKRGNVIISRRKYIEEQRSEDKKKALEIIAENQIIQGIVKNITSYGVFVDVGGIDGLLHITDMSWGRIAHPSELVHIGDTITTKVISFDKAHEKISLGMKQLSENPWQSVDEKYALKSTVKGRISSITDYGLFIEVERGVEGLVHISEVSWTERIRNLADRFSVGDEVEAIVVALDKNDRRMSLSVKQLQKNPWETVAETFKPGDKVTGTISNITDFGIFVQIMEGVDGLIHISDLSWTDHVSHPGERFKKEDTIEAIILAVDPENRKVSLGVKQLEKDPWTTATEEYAIGKEVEGTVSKITNFGAFIKLPTGIEGLVHISELSDQDVEKVEDILEVGETKTFRIIKVRPEDRKIGLSLKAESIQESSADKYQQEDARPKREYTHREKSDREGRQQPKYKSETKDRDKEQRWHQRERGQKNQKQQPSDSIKSSLQQALEQHMKKNSSSEDEE